MQYFKTLKQVGLVPQKVEGKCKEKKNGRKIKNIFKINKLFLYISSNSFHLFFYRTKIK